MTRPGIFSPPVSAKSKDSPTPEDFGFAENLHVWVQAAGIHVRRFNRSASAAHFSRLRREVGAARVEAALAWLIPRLGADWVPQAWCGKSFRTKFAAIEAAAERDLKKNPPVVVGPVAASIASRLARSGFDRPRLAEAVQLSTNFVAALADRLSREQSMLALKLLHHEGLIRSASFVERWYSLAKWIKGELIPRHVLSADNPEFDRWGKGKAAAFGRGRADAWNKVMGEMRDAH